jgi:hypothetical protein
MRQRDRSHLDNFGATSGCSSSRISPKNAYSGTRQRRVWRRGCAQNCHLKKHGDLYFRPALCKLSRNRLFQTASLARGSDAKVNCGLIRISPKSLCPFSGHSIAQDKTSGPTSVEVQSVGPGQAIRQRSNLRLGARRSHLPQKVGSRWALPPKTPRIC